jgi:hypothetical protein
VPTLSAEVVKGVSIVCSIDNSKYINFFINNILIFLFLYWYMKTVKKKTIKKGNMVAIFFKKVYNFAFLCRNTGRSRSRHQLQGNKKMPTATSRADSNKMVKLLIAGVILYAGLPDRKWSVPQPI